MIYDIDGVAYFVGVLCSSNSTSVCTTTYKIKIY